jgi:hypothetical protein
MGQAPQDRRRLSSPLVFLFPQHFWSDSFYFLVVGWLEFVRLESPGVTVLPNGLRDNNDTPYYLNSIHHHYDHHLTFIIMIITTTITNTTTTNTFSTATTTTYKDRLSSSQTRPPVLPCLQSSAPTQLMRVTSGLVEAADSGAAAFLERDLPSRFFVSSDEKERWEPSENTDSLGSLVYQFFLHYLQTFAPFYHCVSVRVGHFTQASQYRYEAGLDRISLSCSVVVCPAIFQFDLSSLHLVS